MRASSTPYANWLTAACWSSDASNLAATGPALSSAAEKTVPISNQPRFCVTSFHGAAGPGSVAS